MPQGTVRWFDTFRNFGFIASDDGGDVFVHGSAIAGGATRTLTEGQRVQFDIQQDPRGPRAINVITSDEYRPVPPSDRPRRERGGGGGFRRDRPRGRGPGRRW